MQLHYYIGMAICVLTAFMLFIRYRHDVSDRGDAGALFWGCVAITIVGIVPYVNLLATVAIICSVVYTYAGLVFPNMKED